MSLIHISLFLDDVKYDLYYYAQFSPKTFKKCKTYNIV